MPNNNFKFYISPQDGTGEPSGVWGSYTTYSWDKYTMYNSFCEYLVSGSDGLVDLQMDYNEMATGEEDAFCMYYIYF